MATLGICNSRIKTYLKHSDSTGTPTAHSPASNDNSRGQNQLVVAHINSCPCVESPYCRASTLRQYIEPTLSIRKLYDLYKEWAAHCGTPLVKFWKYEQVFTTKFNLIFHTPRKDVCDKCREFAALTSARPLNDTEQSMREANNSSREQLKNERHKGMDITNEKTLVISFDLENVFALPVLVSPPRFTRGNRMFSTWR